MITGEQIKEARELLRWEHRDLAFRAKLKMPALIRAEGTAGSQSLPEKAVAAIQRALEAAGVEFIPENGGGAGVRLRKAEAKR